MEAQKLKTKNFFNRLNKLCDPSKIYTSFHVQKESLLNINQDRTSNFTSQSFLPFVQERDHLGRLIENVFFHIH